MTDGTRTIAILSGRIYPSTEYDWFYINSLHEFMKIKQEFNRIKKKQGQDIQAIITWVSVKTRPKCDRFHIYDERDIQAIITRESVGDWSAKLVLDGQPLPEGNMSLNNIFVSLCPLLFVVSSVLLHVFSCLLDPFLWPYSTVQVGHYCDDSLSNWSVFVGASHLSRIDN